MTFTYFIEVYHHTTKEIVRRIECGPSRRKAEKVQMGVSMQASDKYKTRIAAEKGKAK